MQVKKVTGRTLYGTTDWFKIENGGWHVCILSPRLFNIYAEHIMQNAWPVELQTGIKIARRKIKNLSNADDTTRMGESEEELKSLLRRWKRIVKKSA